MDTAIMERKQFRLRVKRDECISYSVNILSNSGFSTWNFDLKYKKINNRYALHIDGRSHNSHDKSFCNVHLESFRNMDTSLISESTTFILKPPLYNKLKFSSDLSAPIHREFPNTLHVSVTIGSCHESCKPLSLLKMLDNGSFADVVIKTQSESIPCHKVVLSAGSDFFKKMFESGMKESQQGVVDWTVVFDAVTVRDLLHYLYAGEDPPNIKRTCIQLVEAASLCMIEKLKKRCVNAIAEAITDDNVIALVKLADKLSLENLKQPLFSFLAANYSNIVNTEAWVELEPEMVKKLMINVFEIYRSEDLDVW